MTRLTSDRPAGLMADLEICDRSARNTAPRRLPNTRALAVLDQMFCYYEPQERPETADSSYDVAA